jgi:hypothetical protein
LFPGGLDGTLFLEFACHAAGACCVLLCIMPACFKTIEVLLGTIDFALRLFQLQLVQGELCTSGGGICIWLGTGIHGGAGTNEAFCGAAFGVSSPLGLLV